MLSAYEIRDIIEGEEDMHYVHEELELTELYKRILDKASHSCDTLIVENLVGDYTETDMFKYMKRELKRLSFTLEVITDTMTTTLIVSW